jgi:DUF4097 and DUF4098 domain-containing protein YvlB
MMHTASDFRSIFRAYLCYFFQQEGGQVINIIAVILVSFQVGNPAVATALPNAMIGFFEKTEEFRETYEVSPGTQLKVINVNGDICLENWDKAYVEVHAVKKTNHDRDELAKVRVDVVTGEAMEIQTEYLEKNARVSVNYQIRIPEGVMVQKISTSNGDIELKGTMGDTEVMTSNGDIDLRDIAGTVQVHTSNGGIDIRGTTAIFEAKTSNGHIRAEIQNMPEGGTDIATSNGSIELYIDDMLNADVSGATSMGEVSVKDLDLGSRFTARTGSSTVLKGKIGKGGALIDAHTSNGSIRFYSMD